MKTYTTFKKMRGYRHILDDNCDSLYEVRNSERITDKFSDFDEFISKNKPSKPSEKLLNAIKKAIDENGQIRYNCGYGNQTFYFSDL